MLRADLTSSDAETEHLLAHLALLQRQVSSAAAEAASSSNTAAAAAAGAVGPAVVLASEVEFLREVSMAGDRRHTTSSCTATAIA